MVRAVLRDIDPKTMTRRLITPRNSYYDGGPVRKARWDELDWASQDIFVDKGPSPSGNPGPYLHVPDKDGDCSHRIYPRFQPGDGLWGRETHTLEEFTDGDRIVYQADRAARWKNSDEIFWLESNYQPAKWRPSIHMHRWASRINLEITGIRIERLKDISEADCIAEGCTKNHNGYYWGGPHAISGLKQMATAKSAYQDLWESINGSGSWALNPWLWVVEFKRVTA